MKTNEVSSILEGTTSNGISTTSSSHCHHHGGTSAISDKENRFQHPKFGSKGNKRCRSSPSGTPSTAYSTTITTSAATTTTDADVPIYLAAVIILERLLKHDEHNRKGRRKFISQWLSLLV